MAPYSVTLSSDTWAGIQAEAAAILGSGSPPPPVSTPTPVPSATPTPTPSPTSTPVPTATPTPTPTPVSTLPSSGVPYPMPMPSNITGGAPVTLGTGPNSITLSVSNNPGSPVQNQFVVILQQGTVQTVIAGPLTVTSEVGASQAGSQIFTLNGTFQNITGVALISTGNGVNGLWVNQLAIDFIPWYVNADAANSRSSGTPNYLDSLVFNSNGTNMTFIPQAMIPPQPTASPVVAASIVSDAMIDTTIAPSGTLATLLTATPAGEFLILKAETIVGSGSIGTACTIQGAGMDETILNATNFPLYQNKAVLVPLVPGVTITDLSIKGAQIATALGNNGAGVRDGGTGIGFTLERVKITGCQDGILTFQSNVTLTDCETSDNGAGDGFTHEMYFGGSPTVVVNLTNHTSTCGPLSTHALKSRAGTTNLTGGTFTGSADTTGSVGGSVIDIPDAGLFSATGTTLMVSAGAANTLFFGYGMESALNAETGVKATFTNCVFTDHSGSGGQIQNGGSNPTAELILTGCTYTGTVAPQISGFAKVTGTITQVVAPTASATIA